ncbi:hypothetical protein LTR86_011315, partial [Recurvomyces mirabilis]
MSETVAAFVDHDDIILKLPVELQEWIFGFLRPTEMMTLDQTCKALHGMMPTTYRIWYGKAIAHRVVDDRGWKAMAVEMQEILENPRPITPQAAVSELHGTSYLFDRSTIAQISQEHLKMLRQSAPDTHNAYEAIATALVTQSRHQEAVPYYRAMEALPERTWLTAARFGWETGLTLPQRTSKDIRERAIF